MSFNFFEDVLAELDKKLNYDAIVNYAGNSFAGDKSWKMIQEAYPLMGDKKRSSVMSFLENVDVQIRKKE